MYKNRLALCVFSSFLLLSKISLASDVDDVYEVMKYSQINSCKNYSSKVVPALEKLYKEGNIEAKAVLARDKMTGNCFTDKNYDEGKRQLEESLSEGSSYAHYYYGLEYSYLDSTNYNKSKFHFMKAIEMGNTKAKSHYGEELITGYTQSPDNEGAYFERDYQLGVKLLEEAALKSDPDAFLELARIYSDGIPVEGYMPDYQKHYEYVLKAVETGHPYGYFLLAKVHKRGFKIKRDFKLASELIFKAREHYTMSSAEETSKLWANLAECEQFASIEMFGVKLLCTNKNEFRQRIKASGAVAIREDNNYWGDLYDPSEILPGASKLYVEYTDDGRLSMVQYYIDKSQLNQVLTLLKNKYGKDLNNGQFDNYKFKADEVIDVNLNAIYDTMELTIVNKTFKEDQLYVKSYWKSRENHSENVEKYKKLKKSKSVI